MKKEIRRFGNSAGIIFSKEDMRINRFNIGDIIDFEPIIIKRNKKKQKW